MGELEQKILAQYPLKPPVWWRYIDDVFMIWPHGEEKLNEFVSLLNSSHETIKFTHEVSPSKINFLDVTVLLHNNSIATDLHVKSTDTHQYHSVKYILSPQPHKKVNPIQPCTKNSPVSAPPMTILNNALMKFWNFSVNAVTKEITSKHKSTKLSMSHVKTLSTTNTRNPSTVQHLSLPTTQVYQILIISLKNILLYLRPLTAAKMPLKIHLSLPTAALATFAIPSYVLKFKHPNLHHLLHQK